MVRWWKWRKVEGREKNVEALSEERVNFIQWKLKMIIIKICTKNWNDRSFSEKFTHQYNNIKNINES